MGASPRCDTSTGLPRPSAPLTHSRTQWGSCGTKLGQCHLHPPSLRPRAGPVLQKGSGQGTGWDRELGGDVWHREDMSRTGQAAVGWGISVLSGQFGSTSDEGGSQVGQEKSL